MDPRNRHSRESVLQTSSPCLQLVQYSNVLVVWSPDIGFTGLDLQLHHVLAELCSELLPEDNNNPMDTMVDSLMAINRGQDFRNFQDADTQVTRDSQVPGNDAVAYAIHNLLDPW